MSSPLPKSEMLQNLRTLLGDVFRLRNEGATGLKIARAQGYLDGYMRMLMDAQIADQRELLAVVTEQRRVVDGPATVAIQSESPTHVVAA